jgi:glycosyltransferase involved in cell wall biosynthesis
MNILLVTQKVDKEDSVLGFFHGWIIEFSKQFEHVLVICLEEGKHNLPSNVRVLSLGKEHGASKFEIVKKFYTYIWKERHSYDNVFVHMNQEYVLLAGDMWRAMGKKVYMWRNHPQGSLLTHMAVVLANTVYCTSPKSYTAKFLKTKIMPAGIDTEKYAGPAEPKEHSILFFGRLSPVKNVHVFIESLKELEKTGIDFHADIIGSPANESDIEYERELHTLGDQLVSAGKLTFKKSVAFEVTAGLYKKYSMYMNLTPNGSLDKTMLEAGASGIPILISNSAFSGNIPEVCEIKNLDPVSIAESITTLLYLSSEERKKIGEDIRVYVEREHSLTRLVSLIAKDMNV